MSRLPHGEDSVVRTGVAGEIFDSSQTTVPGPAAWPRPKASQRVEPSPIRPDTSPLADRARRASRAWPAESTSPTAGPLPATAVTVVSAPRWAVTSHVRVLAVVVTERAASANNL